MSRRADIITAALAVVIHGAAVFAIARRHAAPSAPRPRPVEVEFRRPTPPPPPTAVAPAPPPPRTAPRPAPRRLATTAAPRPTAPAPAPSARPTAAKAPPAYAIAMESPTDASSPVAAPRGGGSSRGSPLGAGRSGGGGGSSAGSGVGTGSGLDIKRMPEIDTDACGRSAAYPSEAERAGVEGKVRLRVALDAGGRVTSARVLRGLGHGLDEAAVEALTRRCRFTPALASDGRPVPFVIESYSFVFELPR